LKVAVVLEMGFPLLSLIAPEFYARFTYSHLD